MKKYLILVLIVLIVGTLVIGVQAASGKVTKLTGKDAVEIVPTRDVYPGYGNDDNQLPEAKGKVNMIQPNGNVDVILGVSVDGLHANTEYIVYFDTTGNSDNGPWVLMGYFTTNEYGHGDWNYTAPAGTLDVRSHTWSVAINRMDNETVLISNDLEFDIVAE
jgi:hypothetical protein